MSEAHEKAAELKAALKRGDVGVSSNMPVKNWAMEWLEVYKKPTIGEGQYRNYLLHIEKVILPAIGNKQIKNVKDVELQKILNSRAGKSKSDLSKLRMTIKAIFKRAHASKLISYNPAEYLELPAANAGKRRSITPYERQMILSVAAVHHAGLWMKMILYCGLRPGECRALDWRHIDFDKKLIHVERAMKSKTTDIDKPKTEAGVRDVPIPDRFLCELRGNKGLPFSPVFVQPTTGRRHTEESMRCLWENFRRELDISMGAKLYRNKIVVSTIAPDLVPYCLRHTYCTDLQDAGVAINVAKYLMGHSDISVTAQIYTHITDKSIESAAEKINLHA